MYRLGSSQQDWDTIRFQSRDFRTALGASRQFKPMESPYTYVEARVSIDGVVFPKLGLRKKGFIGSLSHTRPSLKIKLNHIDKEGEIEGLTNLTLNNNKQDTGLVSQFMGYALFNAIGSPVLTMRVCEGDSERQKSWYLRTRRNRSETVVETRFRE